MASCSAHEPTSRQDTTQGVVAEFADVMLEESGVAIEQVIAAEWLLRCAWRLGRGRDCGLQLHYLTPFQRESGRAALPADPTIQPGTALEP